MTPESPLGLYLVALVLFTPAAAWTLYRAKLIRYRLRRAGIKPLRRWYEVDIKLALIALVVIGAPAALASLAMQRLEWDERVIAGLPPNMVLLYAAVVALAVLSVVFVEIQERWSRRYRDNPEPGVTLH